MTSTAPSPMPTPDLAGLLRRTATGPASKPTRPAAPAPAAVDDDEPPAAAAPDQPAPATSAVPAASAKATPPPAIEVAVEPKHDRTMPQPNVPARASTNRSYRRPVGVSLTRGLHRELHAAATERSLTATALILEAVNTTHARLGDALSADQAHTAGPGNLFDVPQARPPAEPKAQTTIRVTDAQYEALTVLAERHHSSRSAIIDAALRLYLAGAGEGVRSAIGS